MRQGRFKGFPSNWSIMRGGHLGVDCRQETFSPGIESSQGRGAAKVSELT